MQALRAHFSAGINDRARIDWEGCARSTGQGGDIVMEHGPTLLDLIIALLQTMVILLLACGIYLAFAGRARPQASAEPERIPSPRGPRGIAGS
jgi:hypothetical protein